MLNKETNIWPRNEKGELLPQEVQVPDLKDSIRILPITWGAWKELITQSKESGLDDVKILSKYCVEPKFTEEEAKLLKAKTGDAITKAILRASGLLPEVGDPLAAAKETS